MILNISMASESWWSQYKADLGLQTKAFSTLMSGPVKKTAEKCGTVKIKSVLKWPP